MRTIHFVLYLCCVSLGFSQCDWYLEVTEDGTGYTSGDEFDRHALNLTVTRCLPEYYHNFGSMLTFQYYQDKTPGVWSSLRYGRRRNTSNVYSNCSFEVDSKAAEICDASNCIKRDEIDFGYFDDGCYNQISYKNYGYDIKECNLFSNNTMFYNFECECNNTYSLTVYQLNGISRTCLFKNTFHLPYGNWEETLHSISDQIDCAINECSDNSTETMDNYIDKVLWTDSQCTKDCTIASMRCPTKTENGKSESDADDDWFIIGVTFIVLCGVVTMILCYCIVIYFWEDKFKNDAKVSSKGYNQTAADEAEIDDE